MHIEVLESPVSGSLHPGKGVISIRGAAVVDLPLVVDPASFSHKLRYECFTAHKALHVYIQALYYIHMLCM